MFPVACYDDDLIKKSVPWHWHDELEAVIVSEGTALIAAGTKKYTVKQGEGIFINAGILHAAWSMNCSVCHLHSITFHPRLIGGSIDSIFWHNYVQPLLTNPIVKHIHLDSSEAWHKKATHAIESAWNSCANEPFGYEFQVRSSLSELILHLSAYHPVISRQPSEKVLRNSNRLKLMLQFIQDHYPDQINVSMIADTAMISESECLRCFRNIIGIPPIQYLKQFRIQKAVEFLTSTNETIAKIGAQCGFQDTSYFVKTFREQKKCTPSEYRKNDH
ncbi:AraC family transcriptional regulator [Clostridium butyricum]